jgi:hypothetical protein
MWQSVPAERASESSLAPRGGVAKRHDFFSL